jgi:hypothetical protein
VQHLDRRRDVILFCIDCSESMLALYEDPNYEDTQTCHLYTALEAAMQIQKKKIIVGPNDSVGILLFNTVRKFIPLSGCRITHYPHLRHESLKLLVEHKVPKSRKIHSYINPYHPLALQRYKS